MKPTLLIPGAQHFDQNIEVSEKLARLDALKLLLSATIPWKIQPDLKQLLGGESWKVVAHTVHRENLTLRVKDRDSKKNGRTDSIHKGER